jgi:hypothetical protein
MAYLIYREADFGPSSAGLTTVGYAAGGPRTTVGVEELAPGVYGALLLLEGSGTVTWDDGGSPPATLAQSYAPPGPGDARPTFQQAMIGRLRRAQRPKSLVPGGATREASVVAASYPCAIVSVRDATEEESYDDVLIGVTVEVRSPDDLEAQRAGEGLAAYLTKGGARSQLGWWWDDRCWLESGCKRSGAAQVSLTYQLPDVRDMWRHVQQYEFRGVLVR